MKKITTFCIMVVATMIMTFGHETATAQTFYPEFHFQYHVVQKGETVSGILGQYGGSDLITVGIDNPHLMKRWTDSKTGQYTIYPGEMIRVRVPGPDSAMFVPKTTTVVQKNDIFGEPFFWILFSFVMLLLIVVAIIVGILWNRRPVQQMVLQQIPAALPQAPVAQSLRQQINVYPNNGPDVYLVVMEVPTPPATPATTAEKK